MSYEELVRMVADLGIDRGEWAGLPIPMDGLDLVLEPTHPLKDVMENFHYRTKTGLDGEQQEEPEGEEVEVDFGDLIQYLSAHPEDFEQFALDGAELPPEMKASGYFYNKWECLKYNATVHVFRMPGQKSRCVLQRHYQKDPLRIHMDTMGACDAWNSDAEMQAMLKLKELLTPRMFKMYMMMGCFLETSPRSGVTYWFRRLRPTIAMAPDVKDGEMRYLAGLCMHPIGYYQGTWAGVMCPSDDVVAHLMLMRADEHYYWRKANQHPAWAPQTDF